MIAKIEAQLLSASAVRRNNIGTVDVTGPLQVIFNNGDRCIVNAKLRYHGPESSSWLALVVGLRSRILSPFSRFENGRDRYIPCDIPGLVPALALTLAHQDCGLAVSAIAHDAFTHLVLVFEGDVAAKGGNLRSLAASVWTFMKRWTDWTDVLLATASHDPSAAKWNLDWREFLAGESGFVTMPWFRPMNYLDRALSLERIVAASKSLLASVLNQAQMEDPRIRTLTSWLDQLAPLSEVVGGMEAAEAEV
ncbi:MAG: hypothetical protein C4K47_09990 [Candidatus Thorarchaeota archaeon]|nr:MAG: hypothetical protein C4K47_09990 [Candidatus Thorarchaeota archaeon]